jgi:hypothetical protein
MTNFLDIIHRLSLIKKNTYDVSETGVCLRHQVKKDTYSVAPNRWNYSLSPDNRGGHVMEYKEEVNIYTWKIRRHNTNHFNNTPSSQTFRIYLQE